MKFRHEWKHEINYADLLALRMRLRAVMQTDSHTINGKYTVRSLYFDNLSDKALHEKLDGVSCREKFRIRYYNDDTSHIVLEKKSKINSLCVKESCMITSEEVECLLEGRLERMLDSSRPLCSELYSKMLWQGLRPKTIVEYEREPFVFPAGNVRVTIDYNIRTGSCVTDFLSPAAATIPAASISPPLPHSLPRAKDVSASAAADTTAVAQCTSDTPIVLEVKWDEFLPEIIKSAVFIPGRRTSAFSKYARCRIYG